MKRVATVALINDHHLLMGRRRGSGKWTCPGGHLNPGEDPRAGAVREAKEEAGIELDTHLLKHLETRVVTKPDGTQLEVHGFRADLRSKPATTIVADPDEEVHRWKWIKLDTDLDHIKDNLHVPLGDNVLLDNILKDKPMRRHIRRFWDSAKKMGVGEELKDKLLKEGPQQYLQKKDREKKAVDEAALKALGFKDVPPNSAFPKDRLEAGKKVEKEHTTNPEVAEVIAKAHLKEFPPKKNKEDYYEGLDEMEKSLKKQAFWRGFFGE